MNLSSTDIVAYLGAMAWIPQLLKWGFKAIAKPVVTITPEKNVSIGFTSFGSIFNLRVSINVDRKDTVLDFIGVKLTHESGAEHFFEWAGMTEFFSEVKSEKGENQIIQRDVVPISVKLNTLSIVERYFRFQDPIFMDANKIKLDELTEHQVFLKKRNPHSYHDEFLNSKNFDDYLKFFREQFWWLVGTYKVSFIVRSPAKMKFIKETFEFRLTQNDVDSLKNNLNEIKNPIENYIKKGVHGFIEHPFSVMAWINPRLQKIKK